MCIRCFSILLKEKEKLFPYTGIILGNLFSYLMQLFKLSPNLSLTINSLFLLGLYFIKTSLKFSDKTQFKDFIRDKIYLFLSFFVFYFSSPFFYDWFFQNFSNWKIKILLDLFFYVIGNLFFLLWAKFFNNIKYFFSTPIFPFSLLSFGSITMYFDNYIFFLMTKFLVFTAIGIMDIFSLFLFVSRFSNLKALSLLYGMITLAIALGSLFYNFLVFYHISYKLSYLSIVGLIGLLVYYKFYFSLASKKDFEEVSTSEVQSLPFQGDGNLTLEIFQKRINENLPPHVKKLSKRESEVLFLYAIQEKNLTEISQILNISRSSVREYLRRASLKLGVGLTELPKFVKNFFYLSSGEF